MSLSRYTNYEEDIINITRTCRVGIVVYAEGAGIRVTNNSNCCAERRLLSLLEYEAKREGQKGKKIGQWIRKKTNGYIKIWRYIGENGDYGKVFPCCICRKSIQNFNLKVLCTMGPNEWFMGYMNEENKIHSKPTTGQRLLFNRENKFPINSHYHV
jgi:hypothetical protein